MATTETKKDSGINPLRNFLILVVGFASLACIAVGLVLAFASANFNSAQVWAMIGFLFAFPFFGVGVIAWLVLRHANKLAVSSKTNEIKWEIVSSEKQKENLNRAVNQLAAIMKVPEEQLTDLRSAHIVAEDLALRKIQQESHTPIMRYVNVGDVPFSAVYVDQDLITCVQVTFVVSPEIRQERINRILNQMASAKSALNGSLEGSKMRLLLVLVTQLDQEGEEQLRSSLVSKFSATPVDVDIRLLDFLALQNIYSEN